MVEYPFAVSEQAVYALESEWRANMKQAKRTEPSDLVRAIVVDLQADPSQDDFDRLGLRGYRFWQRRAFHRYVRSTRAFVWQRALHAGSPGWEQKIMEDVGQLYVATLSRARKPWQRIQGDLLFFETITDNFAEDGFLSAALHVVVRILGDIEKKPGNLEFSVQLATDMERKFEMCLQEIQGLPG